MKVLSYAEMTWPEVAALPRETPMILPVGEPGAVLPDVERALRSEIAVLLPPLPYGYPRTDGLGELAVGDGLLRRVLRAVARELRAQGFRRIVILDPARIGRRFVRGLRFLRTPAESGPWVWPADLAERVIVISTGHVEQHGYHLPLDTDTRIVAAIASGLATEARERVVCLPAWPYGVSTHTRQFPGTLNLGGRTFEDFFLAVLGRLARLGARAVLFSNGHGGNHSFLVNVVKWAGERWPQMFVATEWLHTTGPDLERLRQSARGGMGHGCELETSFLLHLNPELVRMDRAVKETDFISTPNYYMDWVEGGRLVANPPWTDDTRSGVYGDPTVATAAKGRLWLAAAVKEKAESVDEVQEQARRRRRRRQASPGAEEGRRT